MKNYFTRLLGNEEIKARLGKAIERGTLPHAFLIGGPSGSGKRTLAREICAALNCKGEGASLPCGGCSSCRRIYDGNFPDIKILKKPEDRATIGVDHVKSFREDMFLSSTESEYKIYLIEDAHTMTPEAQNALLKVLEEPPVGVYIFLLADECDKILTTIKSRSQYIAMTRFTVAELSEILKRKSSDAATMSRLDPNKFSSLIIAADGRVGRALSLFDKRLSEKSAEERADVMAFISSLQPRKSFVDIYEALSQFPEKRQELALSLESVTNAIRDMVIFLSGGKTEPTFFTSSEECGTLAREIGMKRLISVYDALLSALELLSKNAGVQNVRASLASALKA
ncbi:MAG: DNA polymerase III subunit [Clostridia bacterium]|nr:DNA polymerase III subunit [Clostridia bacterium]